MTSKHCVKCGGDLVASIGEERIRVGEVAFGADLVHEVCAGCGERFLSAKELERFELAVAVELARIGWRTGSALRFMRKALGFRVSEWAELLGVAPETLSRWETSESEPDAHAFAFAGKLAAERLESERTLTASKATHQPATSPPVTAVRLNITPRP